MVAWPVFSITSKAIGTDEIINIFYMPILSFAM